MCELYMIPKRLEELPIQGDRITDVMLSRHVAARGDTLNQDKGTDAREKPGALDTYKMEVSICLIQVIDLGGI